MTTDIENRTIESSRLLNAPRELVWEVWTDPKHIALWWGPNGFTNTIESMEVKEGGSWRFIMHGPDGVDWPNVVRYTKVKEPELLEYYHSSDDPKDTHKFNVTVTFEKQGEKTLLTMSMVFQTAEERKRVIEEVGAIEGQNQTMNKLVEYLQNLS
ncbi:MAG: SRPBCC family protein [Candidatus Gracilibacteria bacterium]